MRDVVVDQRYELETCLNRRSATNSVLFPARFDVSSAHPDRKLPGSFVQAPYHKQTLDDYVSNQEHQWL